MLRSKLITRFEGSLRGASFWYQKSFQCKGSTSFEIYPNISQDSWKQRIRTDEERHVNGNRRYEKSTEYFVSKMKEDVVARKTRLRAIVPRKSEFRCTRYLAIAKMHPSIGTKEFFIRSGNEVCIFFVSYRAGRIHWDAAQCDHVREQKTERRTQGFWMR